MSTQAKITLKFAEISIIKAQIILNEILPGANIDVDEIIAIKKVNKELSNNKPYVILVKSGAFSTITAEARKLTASKEFAQNTKAKALLANNMGHKLIGSIYLKFDKPYIKTKMFTNETEAINWLEKQLS